VSSEHILRLFLDLPIEINTRKLISRKTQLQQSLSHPEIDKKKLRKVGILHAMSHCEVRIIALRVNSDSLVSEHQHPSS